VTYTIQELMPILFLLFFGLIISNLFIAFVLYRKSKKSIYKEQCIAWSITALGNLFAAIFTNETQHIGLCTSQMVFFFVAISINKLSTIDYDSKTKELCRNYRPYYIAHMALIVLSIILEKQFNNFTITALPISVSLLLIFSKTIYEVFFKYKEISSPYVKMIGFVCSIFIIHSFNFAFFRLAPETQLWGWSTNMILFTSLCVLFLAQGAYIQERDEKSKLIKRVKEQTATLRDQYQSLEKLAADKSALFRVVIHDVSNPLSVAKMAIQLAAKKPQHIDKYLPMATRSIENMADIIKQTRELERAESGKRELIKTNSLVSDLTRTIESQFLPNFEPKGITFQLLDETTFGSTVNVDKVMFINTVIGNLITNAIKFSYPESVITLQVTNEDELISFSLLDKGVGIPKNKIDTLFSVNIPTSTKGTNGEMGTGFGLPLVKKYVESMDGSISLTSRSADYSIQPGTSVNILLPKGEKKFASDILVAKSKQEASKHTLLS